MPVFPDELAVLDDGVPEASLFHRKPVVPVANALQFTLV
jgi:hypothetical protein